MADAPKKPQLPLVEFLETLRIDIKDNKLDPKTAIEKAAAYNTLLQEFKLKPFAIAEILNAPTQEESARLLGEFLDTTGSASESKNSLTQLKAAAGNELPRPMSPIKKDSLDNLQETILERKQRLAKDSAMKARETARKFFAESRRRRLGGEPLTLEDNVADILSKPIFALTEDAAIEEEVRRLQTEVFPDNPKAQEAVTQIIKQDKPAYLFGWDPIIPAAVATKFTYPVVDENAFTKSLERSVKPGAAPTTREIKEATDAGYAAAAVRAPKIDLGAVQLGDLAPAPLSGVVNRLTENSATREAVINRVFINAWEGAVANPEKLVEEMTKRLGSGVVNSPAFQAILHQKYEPKGGGSPTSFVGGVVASVITKPPDKQMFDYVAAVMEQQYLRETQSRAPGGQEKLPEIPRKVTGVTAGLPSAPGGLPSAPGGLPSAPGGLPSAPGGLLSPSQTARFPQGLPLSPVSYIAYLYLMAFPKSVIALPASAGGGGVLQLGAGVAQHAAMETASKAAAVWISKIIGFFGGAEIPLVGQAALAKGVEVVLRPILEPVFKFAGAVVAGLGFVLGGGWLTGADIPPGSEYFLTMIVLPAFIVGVIVILSGTKTPVNILDTPTTLRHVILATSLSTAFGGDMGPVVPGASQGETVSWSYDGAAPVSDVTSSTLGCPVHGGDITQEPNGAFSHNGVNAYDIASKEGDAIYATHDAYVAGFHVGIDPYTFINHSYGNYVLLVGQLPNGTKFFTMYGHLLGVNPVVETAKNGMRSPACKNNDPKLICAGDIIGYEDATGSTWGDNGPGTGVHLHYELQGLGTLVLPPGCP